VLDFPEKYHTLLKVKLENHNDNHWVKGFYRGNAMVKI